MKNKGFLAVLVLLLCVFCIVCFNSLIINNSEEAVKNEETSFKSVILSIVKTPLLRNDDLELNNTLEQLRNSGRIMRLTVTDNGGRVIADNATDTLGSIFKPVDGTSRLDLSPDKGSWIIYVELNESVVLKDLKKTRIISLVFILITGFAAFVLSPKYHTEVKDKNVVASSKDSSSILVAILEKQKEGKSLIIIDSGNRIVFAGKELELRAGTSLAGKKLFEAKIAAEILEKLQDPANVIEAGDKKIIIV